VSQFQSALRRRMRARSQIELPNLPDGLRSAAISSAKGNQFSYSGRDRETQALTQPSQDGLIHRRIHSPAIALHLFHQGRHPLATISILHDFEWAAIAKHGQLLCHPVFVVRRQHVLESFADLRRLCQPGLLLLLRLILGERGLGLFDEIILSLIEPAPPCSSQIRRSAISSGELGKMRK
jgi:hypothetical protein